MSDDDKKKNKLGDKLGKKSGDKITDKIIAENKNKPVAENPERLDPVEEKLGPNGTLVIDDIEAETIYKNLTKFQGHPVIGLLSEGGEAELHILSTAEGERLLKLYRHGINPKQNLLDKIKNLSQDNPYNLVRIYESGINKDLNRAYEIMEYVRDGSLDNYITTGEAKNFDFINVVYQISESIDILHKNDITHADIKPSNILIKSREPLTLILADFGISSIMYEYSIRKTNTKLSTRYAAPEQFLGKISRKSDYWAMGMVLLEILNGKEIFEGINPEGDFDFEKYYISLCDREYNDPLINKLLKGLFTREFRERWGIDEVRSWLKDRSPKISTKTIKQAKPRSKENNLENDKNPLNEEDLAKIAEIRKVFEESKNISKLIDLLKKAEDGDIHSQFSLGSMYSQGDGVDRDLHLAIKWFELAATKGHVPSQFKLALLYLKGEEGIPMDLAEAAKWLLQAAELGLSRAQYLIGIFYEKGYSLQKDFSKAAEWYLRAAEQGHVKAQKNLGLLYFEGKGVAKDDAEAIKWFKMAAEKEDADAMYYLAKTYLENKNDPMNFVDAFQLLVKLSDQGHKSSQHLLKQLMEENKVFKIPIG
jgi:TPR repeat protein